MVLIKFMLSLILIVSVGSIVQRTAASGMNAVQKDIEQSCINESLTMIKKDEQCMPYREKLKSIEAPNCISEKTLMSIVQVVHEAQEHSCNVEVNL